MNSQQRALRSPAGEVLDHVSLWPFIRLETLAALTVLHSEITDIVIAELDLRTGKLIVVVRHDLAARLLADHRLLRPHSQGVCLDVVDDDSRDAAVAVLRWRVDFERFAPQVWESSP